MPAPDPLARIQEADAQASEWATGHLVPPSTRPAFELLSSQLAILVFAPLAIVWIVRAGKRALLLTMAAFGLAVCATLLCGFIALIVQRPSPDGSGLFSFPSGSAADAAALGVFFSLYYVRHAWWTLPISILWAIAPVATHHAYPGDAVVGAVIGFLLGTLAFNATRHNIGRYDIFIHGGGGEISASKGRKLR